MKPYVISQNMFDIQIGQPLQRKTHTEWPEVCRLRQSINYHPHNIIAPGGSG